MSNRANVAVGIAALLFTVTACAYPGIHGGYGGGFRGPAVVAGYRGGPPGAYWGGGRWYPGWGPRAYFGLGVPWFAAGYAPYWYGAPPYYYANSGYYVWDPAYGRYVVASAPPVAYARPPVAAAPPPAPAQPAPQELILKGVDFETASANLRPESTTILDGVADTVKRCNCSGVEIRGYTDSVGDAGYNQKLSEARANAVKEYLEGHGVPSGVLTAHGYGEDNPVASNSSAQGRSENRRVTVQFSAPAGTQRQN